MSHSISQVMSGDVRPVEKRGLALSFGTFGELLQGALPEPDLQFLVTFPIHLYSRATFSVDSRDESLRVDPPEKRKSLELARLMLQHYNLPSRGVLEIASEIPAGKGLASSSADQVAAARAIARCYDLALSHEELEMFLRAIEPTDGVMYPGVVAFYHQKVALREFLGNLPPVAVMAIDEGGVVDTVGFNKRLKDYRKEEKEEFLTLLVGIKKCIAHGDVEGLGRITTRSTILNQRFNPKRRLDALLEVSREVGALGVVTAHSGTCIGLLLARHDPGYYRKLGKIAESLSKLHHEMRLFESWQPRLPEAQGLSTRFPRGVRKSSPSKKQTCFKL